MRRGRGTGSSRLRGRRVAPVALLAGLGAFAVPGPATAQRPPDPPEDLEAEAVSSSRIDLDWESNDDGSPAVRYNVYRDGAVAGSANTTSFRDTGLQPATTYTYTVTGIDDKGRESKPSNEASATTLPDDTPPTTPTGLDADAVSSSRIDLSWSASNDPQSGVVEYRVFRNGSLAGTASGTSFQDTGLEPYTGYEYRVSAVNGAGLESDRSAPASARTSDGSAPTKPTGLQATALSSSRIDLTWSASNDPQSGVAGYRVYRDGALVGEATGTTYQDEGLAPGTEYEYRVSAVNGDGLESDPSDPARATTPRADDTTPPTTPEGLEATALSPRQVQLSWLPSSDPESGIARYEVYRDGVSVGPSTETTFTDGDLQPDTEYDYQVSAINGDGLESERSSNAEVRTPKAADDTPPTAPTGLTATAASATQVNLTWLPAEDPDSGIAGYRVYRGDDVLAEVTGTAYADVDVVADTAYSYQVSAINGEGLEGPRSAVATATTPPAEDTIPPAPPTGLRVVSP